MERGSRLTRIGLTLVLGGATACATAPLPDAESPSAPLRAAIARSEAKLFASEWAQSSPAARLATEDYLAGLVNAAWELSEDVTLLAEPTFDTEDGLVGLPGLFNPDNLYSNALLEPGGRYVIRGRRGTEAQLTIQVLDAYPLLVVGKNRLVIDVGELGVAAGDEFEIHLGGEKRGAHWFPLAEDARALIVRRTFGDWASETPSELRIERLDPAPLPEPSSRFARAGAYLDTMTDLWTGTFLLLVKLAPTNALRAPAPTRDGLAGQYSSLCRFELAADEALLVTAAPVGAKYLGAEVGNPWLVTPDSLRHQVSLSQAQARPDADGKIRYVVAATDPGVPNWLDTAGSASGFLFLRWQGVPAPLGDADASAEVVKLADLRAKLPPDTPRVDAAARAAQLAARRTIPARR